MRNDEPGDWGEAKKEFAFKPAAERFLLLAIFTFICSLWGLYYGLKEAVLGQGGVNYVLTIPSILLLIGSPFILRAGLSLHSNAIRLYERGFIVAIGPKAFPFAWDEIDSVYETVVKEWGSGYWHLLVVRSDGESFGFSEYEIDAPAELREAIRQNTSEHGVSWETQTKS